MDRLLTFEGRQPIWLDDIDFLQDSFAGEIARLVEGLVPMSRIPDVVILKGCEKAQVSTGVQKFNAGIIYCKGEILRVDASSVQLAQLYSFKIYQETDPAGDRILQDTEETVSCYQKRSAAIVASNTDSTNMYLYNNAVRLSDLLENKYGIAENVLYVGGGESNNATSHFKLVRNDSSFTLTGTFNGLELDFELEVNDEYAASHLGNSHLSGEDWNTGKSYGVASLYVTDDANNHEYLCAPVIVFAEPAQDLSYTTLYVRIFAAGSTSTNWSNGNISVKGGFTMNLNTI